MQLGILFCLIQIPNISHRSVPMSLGEESRFGRHTYLMESIVIFLIFLPSSATVFLSSGLEKMMIKAKRLKLIYF